MTPLPTLEYVMLNWRSSREATLQTHHALNNTLAALLAEAQVLSLDPALSEEHRTAVERIVQLTRRVIGSVRALEKGQGGSADADSEPVEPAAPTEPTPE